LFFSIVIPSYNRANCILSTLESVLIQCYSAYEIIFVDDGSSDDTVFIVNQFIKKKRLKNFKFIELKENKGPNVAKNIGAKYSNGKYIIFLDSDDLLHNEQSLVDIKFELDRLYFPDLIMFSSLYMSNLEVCTVKKTNVNFLEYLNNINKGEFLPVVKRSEFCKIFFFENIIGGESLTWMYILKNSGYIFYSKKIARIYNDIDDNRLSRKDKYFYQRVFKIHKLGLKIFWYDYLSTSTKIFFYQLFKLAYYFLKR